MREVTCGNTKNGNFSIICTVLHCCTMCEHPPWQQLFPFVELCHVDVTLCHALHHASCVDGGSAPHPRCLKTPPTPTNSTVTSQPISSLLSPLMPLPVATHFFSGQQRNLAPMPNVSFISLTKNGASKNAHQWSCIQSPS